MESINSVLHQKRLFDYSKGFGKFPSNLTTEDTPLPQWNLLKEDISLPAAVLSKEKLDHNINWMQSFVSHYGFKLVPHGKTTLCPALFHKQIEKGSWGIALSTAVHTQVAHSCGISRIFMMNQLIGKRNMEIISEIQASDPSFEFTCIVDSSENIQVLGEYFSSKNQELRVLLEYGLEGGRTGVRLSDVKRETEVLNEIKKWPCVKLVGVEFFEGIFPGEEGFIRQLVRNIVDRTFDLADRNVFSTDKIILTGGGSAWFDVVAEEFANAVAENLPSSPNTMNNKYTIDIILRPGCYITHGVRLYSGSEKRLANSNPIDGDQLIPALTVWSYVHSIPESGSVIVGIGKRDFSDDFGFPVPIQHFKPGSDEIPRDIQHENWQVVKMMAQHTFLQLRPEYLASVSVGDIVIFGIRHPSTVFDKFKYVLLADENYKVNEILPTYF